jgi:hemolysin D
LKINGLTVMVKLNKLLNTKGIYQMKRLPGMSVTVEIKTGTRRLMEFLLAPLMRGVSGGARER